MPTYLRMAAADGHSYAGRDRVSHRPLRSRTFNSRRLIHFNVTAHPTAQWTRQQLREAVGYEERYEYLLHDRDVHLLGRVG